MEAGKPVKTGNAWKHASREWMRDGRTRRGRGQYSNTYCTKLEREFLTGQDEYIVVSITLMSRVQNCDRVLECFGSWALPLTSTLYPPDVIHVKNETRPSSFFFFVGLLLLCIIVNVNGRQKRGRPGKEAKSRTFLFFLSLTKIRKDAVCTIIRFFCLVKFRLKYIHVK